MYYKRNNITNNNTNNKIHQTNTSSNIIQNTTKTNQFDIFLSHDWGSDSYNHKRVVDINNNIRTRGLITWIDEEQMRDNILETMTKGIDNSRCILIFVTENYMNKIKDGATNDNCKFEFNYAWKHKSDKIILAVMEKKMLNTSMWKGPLGGLSNHLYIDMTEINIDKIDNLYKTISSKLNT